MTLYLKETSLKEISKSGYLKEVSDVIICFLGVWTGYLSQRTLLAQVVYVINGSDKIPEKSKYQNHIFIIVISTGLSKLQKNLLLGLIIRMSFCIFQKCSLRGIKQKLFISFQFYECVSAQSTESNFPSTRANPW